jgi:two-component system, OmpR family, response regulator MprA
VDVLIVDDDEAVRRALTHALRRDGYGVVEAADGGAALEHAAGGGLQAIVLDVLMPEPNGLEVCRILRERGDETPCFGAAARPATRSPSPTSNSTWPHAGHGAARACCP